MQCVGGLADRWTNCDFTPHYALCVQSKSCRDGAACRMVAWRTGEPIVLSHADAALPTTQSEPLRKRFFNILVLIKRDALLAAAGVLNTSQMELNRWKVKGVWMQMYKIQKPRPTLCISACIEKLIIWRNCGVMIMMRGGQGNQSIAKNVTIQLSDRYANIIVVRIEGMFEWAQAIRASLWSFHGNQIDPFQPAQK